MGFAISGSQSKQIDRAIDLFDRLKISQPQTLFDCAFLYDKEPLLWDELTANSGTATWQTNKSCVDFEADIGATAFDTTNAVCVTELGFSALTDQLVTAFENTLLAAADIAGVADIITVTLQRVGNQSESVSVAIQAQEY